MTWSDSHWVLIYSILMTLIMLSWTYVPARRTGRAPHGCINGTPAGLLLR